VLGFMLDPLKRQLRPLPMLLVQHDPQRLARAPAIRLPGPLCGVPHSVHLASAQNLAE
jgi:hypothetical protein